MVLRIEVPGAEVVENALEVVLTTLEEQTIAKPRALPVPLSHYILYLKSAMGLVPNTLKNGSLGIDHLSSGGRIPPLVV